MIRRSALPALLVAALLARPGAAPACGPSFPEVVFTPRRVTSIPLERFLGGELGILQPGYGLAHLWPAYRALLGKRLTAAESQALRELLEPAALQQRRETSPIAA